MDVFLIREGIIENIIVVPSLEWANTAYPGYIIVQRTSDNSYHADETPKNIGDTFA